jgi:hypothetical protein
MRSPGGIQRAFQQRGFSLIPKAEYSVVFTIAMLIVVIASKINNTLTDTVTHSIPTHILKKSSIYNNGM